MKSLNLYHFVSLWLLAIQFNNCHKEGTEDFLFALIQAPPFVIELSPQIGTPRQQGERPFPPTQVSIRGRNMTDVGMEILFNNKKSNIIFNSGTEILTEVPDGAISGRVFARKPGGNCLLESNEGFNCSGQEFFVDCYSPYNRQYGKEQLILLGESQNIQFEGIETRAFRAEIPPLVPEGISRLSVSCPELTTLRYFSPSCVVEDRILVRNPEIRISRGRIMQFFVTARDSTCTIRVF